MDLSPQCFVCEGAEWSGDCAPIFTSSGEVLVLVQGWGSAIFGWLGSIQTTGLIAEGTAPSLVAVKYLQFTADFSAPVTAYHIGLLPSGTAV